MSLRTEFQATEGLLIERAHLHGLVDIFWKHLPNTRDDVYKELSTILHLDDAHISDLTSEQIKQVADSFHKKLADIAPCANCRYSHRTGYGIYLCKHPQSQGAYWLNPESKLAERCKLYVQGHIPSQK